MTAIALVAVALLVQPVPAQQAPIKWKAQTLWNAQERPQKTFEDFCKRVKILTNGRLEIEPFPAGAIAPTNQTLTALQGNVLQAIHVWPGYASGRASRALSCGNFRKKPEATRSAWGSPITCTGVSSIGWSME